MPLIFAGDPIWESLISGPSDTEEAGGTSVTDMGVLLANRTKFLYGRRGVIEDFGFSHNTDTNGPSVSSTTFTPSAIKTTVDVDDDAMILAVAQAQFAVGTDIKAYIALEDSSGSEVGSGPEIHDLYTLDPRSFTMVAAFNVLAGTYDLDIYYAHATAGSVQLTAPSFIGFVAFKQGDDT